jgi:hypothetical protein
MAEVITRRKNQIRPRSRRIRFNNDAILAMSLDGNPRLLVPDPFPLNMFPTSVAFFSNIAVGGAYTGLSDNDLIEIFWDQNFNDVAVVSQAVGTTELLGNLLTVEGSNYFITAPLGGEILFDSVRMQTQFGNFGPPVGDVVMGLFTDNAIAGGDPDNYLDVVLYWDVYNQLVGGA